MTDARIGRGRLDPDVYTVAWIAPLEVEARAALSMLDNRHSGRFPLSKGDDYVFLAGDMCGHNIVVATLPAGQEYGTGSAAALAGRVKSLFTNLWFGLLVGIGAGLPEHAGRPVRDIRLGDVLVALPTGDYPTGIVPYDLGKETKDGFELLRAGRYLSPTPAVVRSAMGSIKLRAPDEYSILLPHYENIKDVEYGDGTFKDPGQDEDVLYDVDRKGGNGSDDAYEIVRPPRPPSRRTRVWYGALGSGDKLVKDAHKRDTLRRLSEDGLIGLEMEAAGTMSQIPVGVIKGVCDYADANKSDVWQPYAAAMAAAYAKAVLDAIEPRERPERPRRLRRPQRPRAPRVSSTPTHSTVHVGQTTFHGSISHNSGIVTGGIASTAPNGINFSNIRSSKIQKVMR